MSDKFGIGIEDKSWGTNFSSVSIKHKSDTGKVALQAGYTNYQ
jgi:hypothetical protein